MSSAVTAAVVVAGGSYLASKGASKSAGAASAASAMGDQLAYEASMAELAFAKEQQANWDKVYGPMQDNLGEYYKTLTPEKYEAMGVQKINEEFAKSEQAVTKALAQRGISNSGIAAASITSLNQTAATDRAAVRATAADAAAAEKKSFLQMGLGQSSGINQLMTNSYNAQAAVGNNISAKNANMANNYNKIAEDAMSGVGAAIGQGISSYYQIK